MILEQDLRTLVDSICINCFRNDGTFDEQGSLDYCYYRNIYANKMEGMQKCLYFARKVEDI